MGRGVNLLENIEAEQSVLGAILVRPGMLSPVSEIIKPTDFYREPHRHIYQAMLDLSGRGEPVDLVTVTALLKERGQLEKVGGPVFLAGLSEEVGFATNAEHYAEIVQKKALVRKIQATTQQISNQCQKPIGNMGDFLDWAESQIFEVTQSYNGRNRRGSISLMEINKTIFNIPDFLKKKFAPKKTILHPWVKEYQIIMIYGPRGVGKSMFVISLLVSIVSGNCFGPWETINPVNCLYLDGEMVQQDTAERFASLVNGNLIKEKLFIYSDSYANSLGIPGANLLDGEWRKAMKEMLLEKDIKIWVADNIASLAPGIDENSKQDWDPINKWFLDLRFAGITTIFLHHTNKEGGQRGTSGREYNIDVSILLDRPKNYVPEDGARFIARFEKARIPHQDLPLIADTEFCLEAEGDRSYIWTFGAVKKQNKVQVIKMLGEGISAKDIAEELGITQGRVSQLKREAVIDGLVTDTGKLTQTGSLYVSKN